MSSEVGISYRLDHSLKLSNQWNGVHGRSIIVFYMRWIFILKVKEGIKMLCLNMKLTT